MALPTSADTRAAKLQISYQTLSTAANTLNTASDKFSAAIDALDGALNKLSPGVTAWVTVNRWTPDDPQNTTADEDRLGFAKVNNRWGLSLCRVSINHLTGDEETTAEWSFNDGPRSLRVAAIKYLPELVENLARQTEHTAKSVSEGADLAVELLQSVNAAINAKVRR